MNNSFKKSSDQAPDTSAAYDLNNLRNTRSGDIFHETLLDKCEKIVDCLEELKFSNIRILDVENQTIVGRYLIFGTARSLHHLSTSSKMISKNVFHITGAKKVNIHGENGSGWIAIDCGDIILHLFEEARREEMSLESFYANKESQTKGLNLNRGFSEGELYSDDELHSEDELRG